MKSTSYTYPYFIFKFLFVVYISICLKNPVYAQTQSSLNTYFVSVNGNDSNNGTISEPWKTLQHAFNTVRGDAQILLRAGSYKVDLNLTRFQINQDNKTVVSNYNNEKVTFEGVSKLNTEWTLWKDGIYTSPVENDIWQLFPDKKVADLARWPNTSFENDSIWSMEKSMRSIDGGRNNGKYTGQSRLGKLYDSDFPQYSKSEFTEGETKYIITNQLTSLAESNIDFQGAYAVLNIGHWMTWTRKITQHSAGQSYFEYDTTGLVEEQLKKYGAYYIYGLAALDKVNEWWYEKDTKLLYYKPSSLEILQETDFYGRDQDVAITFEGCQNITFKGIDFFATGYFIKTSDHIIFEDCNFKYPSTHKFVLGHTALFTSWNKEEPKSNFTTTITNGNYSKFINCTFFRSNAPIYMMGKHMTIDNCSFEDIEWDLNSNGGSGSVTFGENSSVTRCTLKKTGNSEGLRPNGPNGIIQLNRITNAGNLQHDGAAINIGTHFHKNVLVENNWVHDSQKQGIRFDDSGNNQLNEEGEVYGDGIYRNNVTWNTQVNQIKGDRHLVLNNTIINTKQFKNPYSEQYNFTIMGFRAMHNSEANANTVTRNNIAKLVHRTWDLNNEITLEDGYIQPNAYVIPGKSDQNANTAGAAYTYLRDPINYDFRPKKNSPIIDAGALVSTDEIPSDKYSYSPKYFKGTAPDMGAYEDGDENYWIPGRMLEKSSMPVPKNNSTTALISSDLMWLPAYKSSKNKIYLGTAANSLALVSEQNTNLLILEYLRANTTYYWRVDCLVDETWKIGDIWSFTTGESTLQYCTTNPSLVEEFTSDSNADYNAAPWIAHKNMQGEVHLAENKLLIQPNTESLTTSAWNSEVLYYNTSVDIKTYPFLTFKYETPNRNTPFSFVTQISSNQKKSNNKESIISLASASTNVGTATIQLQPILDNWKDLHGEDWSELEKFIFRINPDGNWSPEADGDLWIDDFKVGFSAIKEYVSSPQIVSSNSIEINKNHRYRLGYKDFNIEVSYQNTSYPFPSCNESFENWELRVDDGTNYTIENGVVIPDNNFVGELYVPVTLIVNETEESQFTVPISVIEDATNLSVNKEEQKFLVYPNPAKDNIYITQIKEVNTLEIYDQKGRKVKQTIKPQTKVSLSGISSGIYLLKLVFQDGNYHVEKLIIN
ncbi:MAG: T9SS type A sorting domain-containing protein [Flavicella sp.]